MIDWFLFVFTNFLWGAGNWMLTQKFVNQNSSVEEFPCDNPVLTRLS